MVDRVDRATRSRTMAAIRSKDTTPELAVRKALHARGFRYRTHVANLPGKPDIVLRKFGAVLLVHGCFWHGHDCPLFRPPTTRSEYWGAKIRRNRERDKRVRQALEDAGWRCLTVWECALRGPDQIGLTRVVDEAAAWLIDHEPSMELRGRTASPGTAD